MLRLFQVVVICAWYRLDLLLPSRPWWLWLLFWWLIPRGRQSDAQRLAAALEHLGPIYIKLGQLLSNRADLLPPEVIDALRRLRDQVNPIAPKKARVLIEKELGAPVEEIFAEYCAEPLASASIAQVHAARLSSGEEVVIKIVRPGLARRIRRDIRLLHTLARWLQRLDADMQRLQLAELLDDYERIINDEMNLRIEALYADLMAQNARVHQLYSIARIYPQFTTANLMVSQRIEGIALDDIAALKAAGVNLPLLAQRGVQIFFTQLLVDNFFHADMHPGNHFVDPSNPDDPRYISIDCAIAGSLDSEQVATLVRLFLALVDCDYNGMAREMLRAGWVPSNVSLARLALVCRRICEPVRNQPLGQISLGDVLLQTFEAGREFQMRLPTNLALLNKTLLQVEGLGRQLDPELNIWNIAGPMLRQWRSEYYSPVAVGVRLVRTLESLAQLPEDALEYLRQQKAPATTEPVRHPRLGYYLFHWLLGATMAVGAWFAYSAL